MVPQTSATVAIIGAGAAGLITAHTLLRDGFEHVQVLTRDPSAGGVWAAKRVYPGLSINNVHGEFRFSSLQMPPPADARETGGRLSGEDMTEYMETFAGTFLSGKIRYDTEVLKISRAQAKDGWFVVVRDLKTQAVETLVYDKLVLCTGGCSEPNVPETLTAESAKVAGFTGPVLHSTQFAARLDEVHRVGRQDGVVVVGGGKSAQDVSSNLARRGIRVSMVFVASDAVMATPIPYPAFVRKSRLLSVLSPHAELNTGLERFLHTTWLGALLVQAMWALLTWASLRTLAIPSSSPLRVAPSLFWTVRTNDEGTGRKDGFHALVNEGKIELIAPARAAGFAVDGKSVVLEDGRTIRAGAVVLATGFKSSWNDIFDERTMENIGLGRHTTVLSVSEGNWAYASLPDSDASPPSVKQGAQAPSLYRGIIPAKNILRRDLAVNGAILTTNNGYVFEVAAHWISSYFLGDSFLQLPPTPADAMVWADRNAVWLRRRYPGTFAYANESWSGDLAFWSWPQLVDGLLADMQLRTMRSGGNALTWPFRVIDLEEIRYLKEERDGLRAGGTHQRRGVFQA